MPAMTGRLTRKPGTRCISDGTALSMGVYRRLVTDRTDVWPGKGILATRLGPNRNGRTW